VSEEDGSCHLANLSGTMAASNFVSPFSS
jgi:hypothetical protein